MATTSAKPSSRRSNKSLFRRVTQWLHLWLGLISGIIVFIVCLTGGIWVWRYEVWYFTERQYQRIEAQEKPYLLPSQLTEKARAYLHAKGDTVDTLLGVTYMKAGKSAYLNFRLPQKKASMIYLNPYTGEILKDKRELAYWDKFFIFVRAGHRFLWFPQPIGSPIVGAGCIVFVILLITGLIWWYPSKWTKKTREKSFKIKWSAKWPRLNIDLHNVLGFYTFLLVLALTVSGIVYSFEWFERGFYKTLTFRTFREEQEKPPLSDTTIAAKTYNYVHPEDVIWQRMYDKYGKDFGRVMLDIPESPEEPYMANIMFGDGTILYNSRAHYYDQKTLKEIPNTVERTQPYESMSAGQKLFRMNFDIHTGQIIGLPSKILAFIACIAGASLPVTGFIVWYNRKWGKKKRKKKTEGQPDLAPA